jgi:hypothetical protein
MSQSGIELSGYDFVPLREGGEFTLYRGWQGGNPSPILVVAPAAEHPSPQSLRRLEHEYSLAAEVDPLWPAKPHRAGHLVRVLSRQYSAIKILAKVIDDSALKPRIFRRERICRAPSRPAKYFEIVSDNNLQTRK